MVSLICWSLMTGPSNRFEIFHGFRFLPTDDARLERGTCMQVVEISHCIQESLSHLWRCLDDEWKCFIKFYPLSIEAFSQATSSTRLYFALASVPVRTCFTEIAFVYTGVCVCATRWKNQQQKVVHFLVETKNNIDLKKKNIFSLENYFFFSIVCNKWPKVLKKTPSR